MTLFTVNSACIDFELQNEGMMSVYFITAPSKNRSPRDRLSTVIKQDNALLRMISENLMINRAAASKKYHSLSVESDFQQTWDIISFNETSN